MEKMPILYPGDVTLSAGPGKLGAGIRWITQGRYEPPSLVNHAGLISVGGPWCHAKLIEADWHTREIDVAKRFWVGSGIPFAVYRYRRLDVRAMLEDIERIRREDVGDRYPIWQLGALLVDRGLGKVFGGQPNVVSWLTGIDPRRVCSGIDGKAFVRQGVTFGRPAYTMVDPDDIWDTVQDDRDWACIRPLGPA